MRKLILHAGRHKTGTTTLQKFLYKNPEILEKYGYQYPRYAINGDAHHELGAALNKHGKSVSDVQSKNCLVNHSRGLNQEIDKNPELTPVLSSESLQQCDPETVKKFFCNFDIEVVLYIREETGYLLSAYAQRVQASNYTGSMSDFYKSTFARDYRHFVISWSEVFGSSFSLKRYVRKDLINHDIVHDFVTGVLRIPKDEIDSTYKHNDENPTLTADLLAYKLLINQNTNIPSNHLKLLYSSFNKLALEPEFELVKIPEVMLNDIRLRFQKSNNWIAQEFFNRDYLFEPFTDDLRIGENNVTNNDLNKVRAKLVNLHPELESSLPLPDTSLGNF
ncbi:hypothetical protein [Granulosicoccus antarcticus]|uniref:Sulfotransferase domain-containing protein n=1 Tax=Granulosicoccus antarcticus IMCC3135 TaxID=1192854 RepID=A0A2Z2NWT6_9GAMM|nr:hypothetical protein [Granulosicoccus antarcticus]ASJ71624.1 hypothetical protein IMCC3135_07595 [Granulosicoccus antarcticus IMCC3135]